MYIHKTPVDSYSAVCPLGTVLPLVEEGMMEREIDRWIGAAPPAL